MKRGVAGLIEGDGGIERSGLSTQHVYTCRVDDRSVVWDLSNRKHLGSDHPERGISLLDIEQVLGDANRLESYIKDREAYQVTGRTKAGRWLVVVWIDDQEGRYPIHARQAAKKLIRRLTNED